MSLSGYFALFLTFLRALKCYDVFICSHIGTLCSMDPWIGEELEIVRLGLIDASLLMQQPDHQSNRYLEWQGEISCSNNYFNFYVLFNF